MRRGHNTERCKICNLDAEEKAKVEDMMSTGYSLRKISNELRTAGVSISYGSVRRHKKYTIRAQLDKPFESYVKKRHEKLTIASLLIEKDVLDRLREKARTDNNSVSATLNWLVHRWLSQKEDVGLRNLARNILEHRMEVGWIRDQRRRLRNPVRISITLDKCNRSRISALRDQFWKVGETKEEEGFWIMHPGEWAYTLVWPSRIAETASQNELLNGILRLVFSQIRTDHGI